MSMDEYIPNREQYKRLMTHTVVDKIFFLSHIDTETDVFVDFGCADGEVIEAISHFRPHAKFIGYDISKEMIAECESRFHTNQLPFLNQYFFTDKLDTVKKLVANFVKHGYKVCLILSSVIHEVYSYSSPEEIEQFWEFCNFTPFEYVAIRDMNYGPDSQMVFMLGSDENEKIYANEKYRQKYEDFTTVWGEMRRENTLHFLLKYRYDDNWEREVKENYLPIWFGDYFKRLWAYDIIFQHVYTLPYIKKCAAEDFDIDLQCPTHCQLLFQRDTHPIIEKLTMKKLTNSDERHD